MKVASILTGLLLVSISVFAAPNLINYQGTLTDGAGAPVDDVVSVEFRLFDADTAGNQLWSETQDVSVQNGIYNVLLGSVTPFASGLFEIDNLWLEVVAAGETLIPRQQLASVPYALKAGCYPGDSIDCYTGDPATRNVSNCQTGTRFCSPAGSGFGSCVGEVVPIAEVCDGFDEDCSGVIDDNLSDTSSLCPQQMGVCAGSQTVCNGSAGWECDYTTITGYEADETSLDGLDNDCDGIIDEALSEPGQLAGITVEHNIYRTEVGTAPLVWDASVAATAQAWADNCDFSHNPGRGDLGENIFFTFVPTTVTVAVDAWTAEKDCYTYGTYNGTEVCDAACSTCGHYTQVIWGNTQKLGCGVAWCPLLSGELWVCNYDPRGNWNGQAPY